VSRSPRKAGRKRSPKQVFRLWAWEELYRHPYIRRWRFHDRDNYKRQIWERIKQEVKAMRKRKPAATRGQVLPPLTWAERIDRKMP
jgi:hypothetical protein